MSSATEPTRKPWHSGTDAIWADSAGSGDTESSPSNAEIIAGHVHGTGFTSGRANWLWAMAAEWLQKVRDVLLPQHTDTGDHWEIDVSGAATSPKLTVKANASDLAATRLITARDHTNTEVHYVTRDGYVFGPQVSQTDTTARTAVSPGLGGILVSSGTRTESSASLGYSDNDATSRTIRYVCPQLPEHAVITQVRVVSYNGHSSNTVDATVYDTNNGDNSTRTSHGTITQITGVTGDQAANVALSGTLTQAGAKAWHCDVVTSNNNALSAYVSKVVWTFTLARL